MKGFLHYATALSEAYRTNKGYHWYRGGRSVPGWLVWVFETGVVSDRWCSLAATISAKASNVSRDSCFASASEGASLSPLCPSAAFESGMKAPFLSANGDVISSEVRWEV
jgi:hypothetical protein